MTASRSIGLLGGVLLLIGTIEAHAGELEAPGTETRGWQIGDERLTVSIAPFYGWIPGVKGDVRALGAPAQIDISPWDIIHNLDGYLDALDGTYIGMGEIRYGDFGLFYDIFYVDYLTGGAIEGRLFSLNVDVAFEQMMATVAGTYRVVDEPDGHLDVLAGLRYQSIDLEVGLTLNGFPLDDLRDGERWLDPIIGMKGRYRLGEDFFVQGWGMVGGFGANSSILLDGFATLGYEPASWIDVWAGYRAAYTDFSESGFEWDITLHGPVIGFDVKF